MSAKMETIERSVIYGLFLLLVSLVGWVGTSQVNKLAEIEKQLTKIQLDLVSIQSQMMDEDKVRQIVEIELLKKGIQ